MSLNLFLYLTFWGQVPDVIGSLKPPGNTLCEQTETLYSILGSTYSHTKISKLRLRENKILEIKKDVEIFIFDIKL